MDAAPVHRVIPVARRAERRAGVHELVREMSTDWLATQGSADVQTLFLERLRRVLPLSTIRFNELPNAPTIRPGRPVRTRDYVAFAVPVSDTTRRIVLEATVTSERLVDEWTCQVLETAASLATLLFDTERLAKLQDAPGHRPDGAAPLIGSSVVMQALRERIERVATTDFTVLIEGPIDP